VSKSFSWVWQMSLNQYRSNSAPQQDVVRKDYIIRFQIVITQDRQCHLENHTSKRKQMMQREICKIKSVVDPVPYHSSLPYRFCYESHLRLFVDILQFLPSFPARRIFALFGPITLNHTSDYITRKLFAGMPFAPAPRAEVHVTVSLLPSAGSEIILLVAPGSLRVFSGCSDSQGSCRRWLWWSMAL